MAQKLPHRHRNGKTVYPAARSTTCEPLLPNKQPGNHTSAVAIVGVWGFTWACALVIITHLDNRMRESIVPVQ